MSDYFQLTDLEALIPSAFLVQALDDDGDGQIDAFETVRSQAQGEVDALIEPRFAVPLDVTSLPQIVKRATITLAAELCYRRRGTPDDANPWKAQGAAMRKILMEIGQGRMQLQATPQRPEPLPAGVLESWESPLGAPGGVLG